MDQVDKHRLNLVRCWPKMAAKCLPKLVQACRRTAQSGQIWRTWWCVGSRSNCAATLGQRLDRFGARLSGTRGEQPFGRIAHTHTHSGTIALCSAADITTLLRDPAEPQPAASMVSTSSGGGGARRPSGDGRWMPKDSASRKVPDGDGDELGVTQRQLGAVPRAER